MNRSALLLALAAASLSVGRPDDQPADVPALVRDLGADDFDKREAAEAALLKAGPAAADALRRAADGDDPEVAVRAKRVLKSLEWWVPGGTPKEVIELVRLYREASAADQPGRRVALLEGAARAGKAGVPVARVVAAKSAKGPDDEFRRDFLWACRRAVPRLVLAGREDDARAVLEAAVDLGPPEPAAADYAAYFADVGGAAAEIPRWEKRREADGRDAEAAEFVLLNLYRLTGDRKWADEACLWVADRQIKKSTDPPDVFVKSNPRFRHGYQEELLYADGRWADVAALVDPRNATEERITVYRLAGMTRELDAVVREVKEKPGEWKTPDAAPLSAVRILLLAGRPDDAAELAGKKKLPLLRMQVAVARFRSGEAAAAPDGAAELKGKKPDEWRAWAVERAGLLARLGRRADAEKLFDEAAATIPAAAEPTAGPAELVSAENAAGFADRAVDRAAKYLADHPAGDKGDPLGHFTPGLFGEKASEGHTWVHVLRKPGRPADALRLARKLLAGTATDAEYAAATAALKAAGADLDPRRRLDAVAAAALACNRDADAEAALRELAEKSPPAGRGTTGGGVDDEQGGPLGFTRSVRPWVAWGNFLADRGRHKEAAAEYLRGWDRYPDTAILLYLSGKALAKAGDAAEGDRRVRAAFRVPLGDPAEWGHFLDGLLPVATPAELKRAADAAGRTDWGRSGVASTPRFRRSQAYQAAGEFALAARAHDSAVHALTTDAAYFEDLWRYLRVPAWSMMYRGQALLKDGKPKEAAAEFRAYFRTLPGEVTDAIRAVAGLDRAGAKADADELFKLTADTVAAVLREYPDAANWHNDAAWLRANCRRDLDAALAHVRKATALAPDNKAYQDTLAEVHFRRGEKGLAVAVMGKLVDATRGRKAYYVRQLDRFKAGDVSSDPPADE